MPVELRAYQQRMLGKLFEKPRFMDYSDPGVGKTAPAIVRANLLYRSTGKKAVFLCPTSLIDKNYDECFKFGDYTEDEVIIVRGTPKKRAEQMADKKAAMFVMGYVTFKEEFDNINKDVSLIIADESHKYWSTHSSAITQSMYRASRRFEYFEFMTATPFTSKLDSIYPFFAVACPRAYCTYQNFMRYHAIYNDYGQVVAWKNHDKIVKVLSQFGAGVTVKQAYPNAAENNVFFQRCELDKHQEAKYKEFEREALIEMDNEDKFLEATNSGVQTLRCRQILSTPEQVGVVVKKKGKLETLKEHLMEAKERGEQVIVFFVFKSEGKDAKEVCDSLGIKACVINGDVPSKKRGEMDAAFKRGEIDVMIGSVETCAEGFNWENADRMIFLTTTYQYSDLKQALFRGNRGGRKTALKVYILHYGTKVERRVFSLIKRKEGDSGNIMKNLPEC